MCASLLQVVEDALTQPDILTTGTAPLLRALFTHAKALDVVWEGTQFFRVILGCIRTLQLHIRDAPTPHRIERLLVVCHVAQALQATLKNICCRGDVIAETADLTDTLTDLVLKDVEPRLLVPAVFEGDERCCTILSVLPPDKTQEVVNMCVSRIRRQPVGSMACRDILRPHVPEKKWAEFDRELHLSNIRSFNVERASSQWKTLVQLVTDTKHLPSPEVQQAVFTAVTQSSPYSETVELTLSEGQERAARSRWIDCAAVHCDARVQVGPVLAERFDEWMRQQVRAAPLKEHQLERLADWVGHIIQPSKSHDTSLTPETAAWMVRVMDTAGYKRWPVLIDQVLQSVLTRCDSRVREYIRAICDASGLELHNLNVMLATALMLGPPDTMVSLPDESLRPVAGWEWARCACDLYPDGRVVVPRESGWWSVMPQAHVLARVRKVHEMRQVQHPNIVRVRRIRIVFLLHMERCDLRDRESGTLHRQMRMIDACITMASDEQLRQILETEEMVTAARELVEQRRRRGKHREPEVSLRLRQESQLVRSQPLSSPDCITVSAPASLLC